jgi:hypothetical protein
VQPGKITQGSLDRVFAELRPQLLRRHPPSETNDKSVQSKNKQTDFFLNTWAMVYILRVANYIFVNCNWVDIRWQ